MFITIKPDRKAKIWITTEPIGVSLPVKRLNKIWRPNRKLTANIIAGAYIEHPSDC
jgi:hypothetical protein